MLNIVKSWLSLLTLILMVGVAGCGGGSDSGTKQLNVELVGGATVEIPFGSLWEDPGVTVSGDNASPVEIVIKGKVDTSTPGDYEIVYMATTADGRSGSANRIVTVNPRQFLLTVSSFGDGTIYVTGTNIDEQCSSGTCRFNIDEGAAITLTAATSAESEFEAWDFCDSVSGSQCMKTVNANVLVSATFLPTAAPTVKSNVVTLSDDQIKGIQGYSSDSNVIEFMPGTDLSGINVDTIIVSKGIYLGDGDPGNIEIYFARRVREIIELTGSTVIVKTVKVSLGDIFDSGSLSIRESVTQKKSNILASKSNVLASKVSYSLPVDVKVGSNFTVQGQISFDVDPSYNIEFEGFGRIKSARAIVRLSHSSQLGLEIKDALETPGKKFKLGSRKITPIIIPTPVGVPVVLVPEVTFYLAPKAVAEASLNPSVSVSNTTIAGAHYHVNSGWTNLGEYSQSVTGTVGQVKGRIAAEVLVVAEIATEVYDLAGPLLSAGPGAGVEAVVAVPPTDNCAFEYGFYFKLGANIGGKFSAFGKELKYEAKVIDESFPVGGKRCIEDSEPPSTPLLVKAEALSDENIQVSWGAAQDNVRVAHYEIWRRSGPLQMATRIQDKWVGTEFTNTGLEGQEEYCYFLFAVDGKGNISEEPSQLACATTKDAEDVTVPTAPQNLTAEVLSTSAISLSWQPSSDDIAVASYIVYEQSDSQHYALSQTAPDQIQYDVGGLTADTEYCFSVSAIDEAGNESEFSNTVCTTTLAPELAEWRMLLGCQGSEPIIEEAVDLDENVSSRIDVAGIGNDYDGTGLSYVLGGTYAAESGDLSASITWRFEGSINRRVDEFTANLSSGDTGRVPMNQVEVTGCDADVQFVRAELANKPSARGINISESSDVNIGSR